MRLVSALLSLCLFLGSAGPSPTLSSFALRPERAGAEQIAAQLNPSAAGSEEDPLASYAKFKQRYDTHFIKVAEGAEAAKAPEGPYLATALWNRWKGLEELVKLFKSDKKPDWFEKSRMDLRKLLQGNLDKIAADYRLHYKLISGQEALERNQAQILLDPSPADATWFDLLGRKLSSGAVQTLVFPKQGQSVVASILEVQPVKDKTGPVRVVIYAADAFIQGSAQIPIPKLHEWGDHLVALGAKAHPKSTAASAITDAVNRAKKKEGAKQRSAPPPVPAPPKPPTLEAILLAGNPKDWRIGRLRWRNLPNRADVKQDAVNLLAKAYKESERDISAWLDRVDLLPAHFAFVSDHDAEALADFISPAIKERVGLGRAAGDIAQELLPILDSKLDPRSGMGKILLGILEQAARHILQGKPEGELADLLWRAAPETLNKESVAGLQPDGRLYNPKVEVFRFIRFAASEGKEVARMRWIVNGQEKPNSYQFERAQLVTKGWRYEPPVIEGQPVLDETVSLESPPQPPAATQAGAEERNGVTFLANLFTEFRVQIGEDTDTLVRLFPIWVKQEAQRPSAGAAPPGGLVLYYDVPKGKILALDRRALQERGDDPKSLTKYLKSEEQESYRWITRKGERLASMREKRWIALNRNKEGTEILLLPRSAVTELDMLGDRLTSEEIENRSLSLILKLVDAAPGQRKSLAVSVIPKSKDWQITHGSQRWEDVYGIFGPGDTRSLDPLQGFDNIRVVESAPKAAGAEEQWKRKMDEALRAWEGSYKETPVRMLHEGSVETAEPHDVAMQVLDFTRDTLVALWDRRPDDIKRVSTALFMERLGRLEIALAGAYWSEEDFSAEFKEAEQDFKNSWYGVRAVRIIEEKQQAIDPKLWEGLPIQKKTVVLYGGLGRLGQRFLRDGLNELRQTAPQFEVDVIAVDRWDPDAPEPELRQWILSEEGRQFIQQRKGKPEESSEDFLPWVRKQIRQFIQERMEAIGLPFIHYFPLKRFQEIVHEDGRTVVVKGRPVKVDGVIPAVYTRDHLSLAEPWIERGVPVWMDKPIVMPGETDRLRRLDRDHPKKVMGVDFFMDSEALRWLMAAGRAEKFLSEIGPIRRIDGRCCEPWDMKNEDRAWLMKPELSGSTGLGNDTVTHPLTMLRRLLPLSLKDAQVTRVVRGRYPDAPGTGETDLWIEGAVGGIPFYLAGGKGIDTYYYGITVTGAQGSIEVFVGTGEYDPYVKITHADGSVELHTFPGGSLGYRNVWLDFLLLMHGSDKAVGGSLETRLDAMTGAVDLVSKAEQFADDRKILPVEHPLGQAPPIPFEVLGQVFPGLRKKLTTDLFQQAAATPAAGVEEDFTPEELAPLSSLGDQVRALWQAIEMYPGFSTAGRKMLADAKQKILKLIRSPKGREKLPKALADAWRIEISVIRAELEYISTKRYPLLMDENQRKSFLTALTMLSALKLIDADGWTERFLWQIGEKVAGAWEDFSPDEKNGPRKIALTEEVSLPDASPSPARPQPVLRRDVPAGVDGAMLLGIAVRLQKYKKQSMKFRRATWNTLHSSLEGLQFKDKFVTDSFSIEQLIEWLSGVRVLETRWGDVIPGKEREALGSRIDLARDVVEAVLEAGQAKRGRPLLEQDLLKIAKPFPPEEGLYAGPGALHVPAFILRTAALLGLASPDMKLQLPPAPPKPALPPPAPAPNPRSVPPAPAPRPQPVPAETMAEIAKRLRNYVYGGTTAEILARYKTISWRSLHDSLDDLRVSLYMARLIQWLSGSSVPNEEWKQPIPSDLRFGLRSRIRRAQEIIERLQKRGETLQQIAARDDGTVDPEMLAFVRRTAALLGYVSAAGAEEASFQTGFELQAIPDRQRIENNRAYLEAKGWFQSLSGLAYDRPFILEDPHLQKTLEILIQVQQGRQEAGEALRALTAQLSQIAEAGAGAIFEEVAARSEKLIAPATEEDARSNVVALAHLLQSLHFFAERRETEALAAYDSARQALGDKPGFMAGFFPGSLSDDLYLLGRFYMDKLGDMDRARFSFEQGAALYGRDEMAQFEAEEFAKKLGAIDLLTNPKKSGVQIVGSQLGIIHGASSRAIQTMSSGGDESAQGLRAHFAQVRQKTLDASRLVDREGIGVVLGAGRFVVFPLADLLRERFPDGSFKYKKFLLVELGEDISGRELKRMADAGEITPDELARVEVVPADATGILKAVTASIDHMMATAFQASPSQVPLDKLKILYETLADPEGIKRFVAADKTLIPEGTVNFAVFAMAIQDFAFPIKKYIDTWLELFPVSRDAQEEVERWNEYSSRIQKNITGVILRRLWKETAPGGVVFLGDATGLLAGKDEKQKRIPFYDADNLEGLVPADLSFEKTDHASWLRPNNMGRPDLFFVVESLALKKTAAGVEETVLTVRRAVDAIMGKQGKQNVVFFSGSSPEKARAVSPIARGELARILGGMTRQPDRTILLMAGEPSWLEISHRIHQKALRRGPPPFLFRQGETFFAVQTDRREVKLRLNPSPGQDGAVFLSPNRDHFWESLRVALSGVTAREGIEVSVSSSTDGIFVYPEQFWNETMRRIRETPGGIWSARGREIFDRRETEFMKQALIGPDGSQKFRMNARETLVFVQTAARPEHWRIFAVAQLRSAPQAEADSALLVFNTLPDVGVNPRRSSLRDGPAAGAEEVAFHMPFGQDFFIEISEGVKLKLHSNWKGEEFVDDWGPDAGAALFISGPALIERKAFLESFLRDKGPVELHKTLQHMTDVLGQNPKRFQGEGLPILLSRSKEDVLLLNFENARALLQEPGDFTLQKIQERTEVVLSVQPVRSPSYPLRFKLRSPDPAQVLLLNGKRIPAQAGWQLSPGDTLSFVSAAQAAATPFADPQGSGPTDDVTDDRLLEALQPLKAKGEIERFLKQESFQSLEGILAEILHLHSDDERWHQLMPMQRLEIMRWSALLARGERRRLPLHDHVYRFFRGVATSGSLENAYARSWAVSGMQVLAHQEQKREVLNVIKFLWNLSTVFSAREGTVQTLFRQDLIRAAGFLRTPEADQWLATVRSPTNAGAEEQWKKEMDHALRAWESAYREAPDRMLLLGVLGMANPHGTAMLVLKDTRSTLVALWGQKPAGMNGVPTDLFMKRLERLKIALAAAHWNPKEEEGSSDELRDELRDELQEARQEFRNSWRAAGSEEQWPFEEAVSRAQRILERADPTIVGVEVYLSPSQGFSIDPVTGLNADAVKRRASKLAEGFEPLVRLLAEGRFVVETGSPLSPGLIPREPGLNKWQAIRVVVLKPSGMVEVNRALRTALQYFLLFQADYQIAKRILEASEKNRRKIFKERDATFQLKQRFLADYVKSYKVLEVHKPEIQQELARLQIEMAPIIKDAASVRTSPVEKLELTQKILDRLAQAIQLLRSQLSAAGAEEDFSPEELAQFGALGGQVRALREASQLYPGHSLLGQKMLAEAQQPILRLIRPPKRDRTPMSEKEEKLARAVTAAWRVQISVIKAEIEYISRKDYLHLLAKDQRRSFPNYLKTLPTLSLADAAGRTEEQLLLLEGEVGFVWQYLPRNQKGGPREIPLTEEFSRPEIEAWQVLPRPTPAALQTDAPAGMDGEILSRIAFLLKAYIGQGRNAKTVSWNRLHASLRKLDLDDESVTDPFPMKQLIEWLHGAKIQDRYWGDQIFQAERAILSLYLYFAPEVVQLVRDAGRAKKKGQLLSAQELLEIESRLRSRSDDSYAGPDVVYMQGFVLRTAVLLGLASSDTKLPLPPAPASPPPAPAPALAPKPQPVPAETLAEIAQRLRGYVYGGTPEEILKRYKTLSWRNLHDSLGELGVSLQRGRLIHWLSGESMTMDDKEWIRPILSDLQSKLRLSIRQAPEIIQRLHQWGETPQQIAIRDDGTTDPVILAFARRTAELMGAPITAGVEEEIGADTQLQTWDLLAQKGTGLLFSVEWVNPSNGSAEVVRLSSNGGLPQSRPPSRPLTRLMLRQSFQRVLPVLVSPQRDEAARKIAEMLNSDPAIQGVYFVGSSGVETQIGRDSLVNRLDQVQRFLRDMGAADTDSYILHGSGVFILARLQRPPAAGAEEPARFFVPVDQEFFLQVGLHKVSIDFERRIVEGEEVEEKEVEEKESRTYAHIRPFNDRGVVVFPGFKLRKIKRIGAHRALGRLLRDGLPKRFSGPVRNHEAVYFFTPESIRKLADLSERELTLDRIHREAVVLTMDRRRSHLMYLRVAPAQAEEGQAAELRINGVPLAEENRRLPPGAVLSFVPPAAGVEQVEQRWKAYLMALQATQNPTPIGGVSPRFASAHRPGEGALPNVNLRGDRWELIQAMKRNGFDNPGKIRDEFARRFGAALLRIDNEEQGWIERESEQAFQSAGAEEVLVGLDSGTAQDFHSLVSAILKDARINLLDQGAAQRLVGEWSKTQGAWLAGKELQIIQANPERYLEESGELTWSASVHFKSGTWDEEQAINLFGDNLDDHTQDDWVEDEEATEEATAGEDWKGDEVKEIMLKPLNPVPAQERASEWKKNILVRIKNLKQISGNPSLPDTVELAPVVLPEIDHSSGKIKRSLTLFLSAKTPEALADQVLPLLAVTATLANPGVVESTVSPAGAEEEGVAYVVVGGLVVVVPEGDIQKTYGVTVGPAQTEAALRLGTLPPGRIIAVSAGAEEDRVIAELGVPPGQIVRGDKTAAIELAGAFLQMAEGFREVRVLDAVARTLADLRLWLRGLPAAWQGAMTAGVEEQVLQLEKMSEIGV